jgi:thymidylate kinase
MNEEQVSALGERGALIGYMAQFGEFARFVYRELVSGRLVWLRLADPDAGKLDDIQYATQTTVHAYQVKWTGSDDIISFTDFKKLLPGLHKSWHQLRDKYAPEGKRVLGHLLTNRAFSVNDSITVGDKQLGTLVKLGTFTDFFQQVWQPLRRKQKMAAQWQPIVDELAGLCGVSVTEFQEFAQFFELHPEHEPQQFSVTQATASYLDEELSTLRGFLMEQVGSPERHVEFTMLELLHKMNWGHKFHPVFNHELVVDARKYQPISRTLAALDDQMRTHKGGYVFLEGGPGSGKSTLLTQWLKSRSERVIRYYAFDFRDPSSLLNVAERGDAASLYFDLVVQLRQHNFYPEPLSPHRNDLPFLLKIFERQLAALAADYQQTGRATILLIDGLDHVPREYREASLSFLRQLPNPKQLPEGVYIVLGSQTYELADLQPAVHAAWQTKQRTVCIAPLSWPEGQAYIVACQLQPALTLAQQQDLFTMSQGHPLYLAYLCGRLEQGQTIEEVLTTVVEFNGDIEAYYRALWKPIAKDSDLVQLLGLVARVNGPVSLAFMQEWPFAQEVGQRFREQAKLLFSELPDSLSFFHNSFRQFLLQQTALGSFTGAFEEKQARAFHRRLADYYQQSDIEPIWKANYHLYRAGELDRFVAATTAEQLGEQLAAFRPAASIEQDAELGIHLACQRGDGVLLARYMFALTEVQQRDENLPLLTKELLALGKPGLARDALRDGRTLLVSKTAALRAARTFHHRGNKVEAAILVGLAEPAAIRPGGIQLKGEERFDEQEAVLVAWAAVARYYQPLPDLLNQLANITLDGPPQHWAPHESPDRLRLTLLETLIHSARRDRNWTDFDTIRAAYAQQSAPAVGNLHQGLAEAVKTCLAYQEPEQAATYLDQLLSGFDREKADDETRIAVAELIYRVHRDLPLVRQWLEGVTQPVRAQKDWDDFDSSLAWFQPLITYNKLLNYLGTPVPVTEAVPIEAASPRELPLLEFQRMLCRMTQMAGEARAGQLSLAGLTGRLKPIVQFYYQRFRPSEGFAYRGSRVKSAYYELLVHAVAQAGPDVLTELHTLLRAEFAAHSEYWEPKVQRAILVALHREGLPASELASELQQLNASVVTGLDMEQRVSESLAQGRAWLQLGEPAEAERWLKQGIREAFSVGYRKDYQFSKWLAWLARINAVQPEQAPERISWFLARLHHLRDTTEGNAYWRAAKQLLGITLDWNFSAGLRQLRWQLDQGLLTLEDALATFIRAYLQRVQTATAYTRITSLYIDLFLRLATEADVTLLEQLLGTGLTILGLDFYQQLPGLVTAIRRRALQNTRAELLSAVEKFVAAQGQQVSQHVPDFAIPPGPIEPRGQGNTMPLRDGRRMDEQEVVALATSYEELTTLLTLEAPDSYFDWHNVLDKLSFQLSVAQLVELAQQPAKRREAHFLAALSRAALRVKELGLAKQLAERSVAAARADGWTSFSDGGSRLAAFAALRAVAPAEVNRLAFATFEHDVLDRDWLRHYVTSLDEILPALTGELPLVSAWAEVFGYVQRLLLTSMPASDLPDLTSQEQTLEEVLADLLGYLAHYPLAIIQQPARGLLARAIEAGDAASLGWMAASPVSEIPAAEVFIEVLMRLSAAVRRQLSVQALRLPLEQVARQPDYWLRTQAQRALAEVGLPLPAVPPQPHPAIYSLALPESSPSLTLDTGPGRDHLVVPGLSNAEEQLLPYGRWLPQLTKVSGLKRPALAHRAAALMGELAAPVTWDEAATNARRQWLTDLGLEYPFLPQRVEVARRALMRLTAELLDAGQVQASHLGPLFNLRDYTPYSFPEVVKPAFVQSLDGHEYTAGPDGWLGTLSQHSRLGEPLPVYETDWVVIGESTRLRGLTWERGTEYYQMQLTAEPADPDEFFGMVYQQPTSRYLDLSLQGAYLIMQRQHQFSQTDYRTTWLALNPLVARHLGWEPVPERLFAWRHQGQLMVESVCWSDGNLDIPSYQSDSIAGEGWLVLASAEALRQLATLGHPLFIDRQITRSETRDQQEIEKNVREHLPYLTHPTPEVSDDVPQP